MTPVVLNGRFLAARQRYGVFRVADQLSTHLDRRLADMGEGEGWSLAHPRLAGLTPQYGAIQSVEVRPLTGQAWEQITLPVAARESLLVNLCNLSPLGHRRAITMIHDTQVFTSPASYSPAFVAWYRFALPRIGAAADRILTVSDFSRRELIRHRVCPADKIVVIGNGVDHVLHCGRDPTIVSRLGLERGTYVVALANTQLHKNLRVLFEAFGRAEMRDVRLVLVGGAAEVGFRAAGHHPPPNVIYAGRISDGALCSLLEAAACLAFPSTTEGFGLPPIEAMLLGCPAVVAPCGALPEVCGAAALYASAIDAQAWARAITGFVDSLDTRAFWSARGRTHAASFTWAKSAERLHAVIDERR